MTRLESAFCAALLLAAPSARAARRAARPQPGPLLDAALAAPATGYAARVKVQHFPVGGAPKAQFREVRWAAPGRERVESFAKRKKPSAVRVWSGGAELFFSVPLKRAWKGPRALPDAAAERRHRARLDELYELSVSTGGQTAKRRTWRLDFRSKADGGLRRSWWVDRETSFPLKREEYRKNGSLRLRERVLKRVDGPHEPALFSLETPAGLVAIGRAEPFLPCPSPGRRAPCAAPGVPLLLPDWLPEGYVLFDVLGSTGPRLVSAFNDGLAPVSVSASARGSSVLTEPGARPYAAVTLKDGRGEFYDGTDGPCLVWRGPALDSVACGDLAEDELARLADSLRPAP